MKRIVQISYFILSLLLFEQFSLTVFAELTYSSTEPTQTVTETTISSSIPTDEGRILTEASSEISETEQPSELEQTTIVDSIIGIDDRYPVVDTTVAPYQSVVMLRSTFSERINYGTGVVVGKDTILTAAHNVYDADKGTWASSVIAYPAKSGATEPYGSYEASDYYMFRAYQTNGGLADSDMAVIKIKNPLPAFIDHLVPMTGVNVGESVQMPGYPYRFVGMMYTMFAPVTIVESNLMAYTVDTESGQSGSPVLNSQNQIVGIHILGNTDYNIARRITDEVLTMIQLAKTGSLGTETIVNYREKELIEKVNDAEKKLTEKATYRVYHPGIKRHLYTQSLTEVTYLSSIGWINEGIKFRTATFGTPVYRLYHDSIREHLYTTSVNERDVLKKRGWRYEGVAWYSNGDIPVYRLYHPGLRVHLYTPDRHERDVLQRRGWTYELISSYAVK